MIRPHGPRTTRGHVICAVNGFLRWRDNSRLGDDNRGWDPAGEDHGVPVQSNLELSPEPGWSMASKLPQDLIHIERIPRLRKLGRATLHD